MSASRLVPAPELFAHRSTLHGQAHVSRVLVHAFRLLEATGHDDEGPRLWAAVFLHDLARTHDGRCYVHGANAVTRLESMPELRRLFAEGGVKEVDYDAIATAVTRHSLPGELSREHPHWRLTALLKDADGLDRVRLGDLDDSYLRLNESRGMIPFAQRLFDATDGVIPIGTDYFNRLWPAAVALARRGSPFSHGAPGVDR